MSSDSEDENLHLLKEAVDADFLSDDMYTQEADKKPEPEKKQPPSLRKNIAEEDDSYNFFKVTPEFQSYVSKQLSKILDKQLKSEITNKITPERCKRKIIGGVRLLSSSKTFLKVKHICEDIEVVPTRPRDVEYESEHEAERLKEAVVDPQYISEEVKHWTSWRKPKVFVYSKKSNGVCELQNVRVG